MNLGERTLIEVAAYVAATLQRHDIQVVVVGGSAITIHAPTVYTSEDIDFAALTGIDRRKFAAVLKDIGFLADGRSFRHPQVRYTLDFVADTPYVDARPITKFATLQTRFGPVRVYEPQDAIADRVAAFLHWNDSESLDVAERALAHIGPAVSWSDVEAALDMLDATYRGAKDKLELAKGRLREALND